MKILRFLLGCYFIPKESTYTYLGISFSNDLSLTPIFAFMETKAHKFLYSFSSFLANRLIPLPFLRDIIFNHLLLLAKLLYFFALHLGSNMTNINEVQSLINTINTSLLWRTLPQVLKKNDSVKNNKKEIS